MIRFIRKDNTKFEYNQNDMKKIKVYETYIKLTSYDNHDIAIDLSMLENIEIENEDLYLFVYTGQEYDQEMKVDYEDYCDLSEEVPYEYSSWYVKSIKDRKYIICDSMLEIYTNLK